MKYLPLIWSGIWRKPGRAVLIFLQVTVAFALFGVLQGLKTGIQHAVDAARADLLLVHSREAFFYPLPLGLLGQIRSLPGVKVVVPVELYGGWYQKPENGTIIVAVSPERDWTEAFTFNIAPQYLAAFNGSRTAALVTEFAAEKYHWRIGDHIPLMSKAAQKDGSTTWSFDVVGTFTDSDVAVGRYKILMHYAYYDEARATGTGTVNHFNVAVTDPSLAVRVADAIDRRFANSSHETKTESLRELAQAQVQQIGDLDFLIRAVVSAVLAALLFAIATMMMQSVRERTSELAILKTIGFGATFGAVNVLYSIVDERRREIATLRAIGFGGVPIVAATLVESILLALPGALLGAALAWLFFQGMAVSPFGFSFRLEVTPRLAEIGIAWALVMGLIGGLLPALRAARVPVTTALRAT